MKNPFSNNKAQNKLEYAFLYVVIFVAIFMMGPYLMMGVNAFFKSTDEQARDSFQDPLMQLPANLLGEKDLHIPRYEAKH